MWKSKVILEPMVLDAISCSKKLTIAEKVSFLRYIWYMTLSEKKELVSII